MSKSEDLEKVLRQATLDYHHGAAAPGDGIHAFLAKRVEAHLALLPPPGWRPIESAPRDGTEVLVWYDECRVARFHPEGTQWGRDPSWGDEDGNVLCDPTHWMPLPAAPVTKTEGGGK